MKQGKLLVGIIVGTLSLLIMYVLALILMGKFEVRTVEESDVLELKEEIAWPCPYDQDDVEKEEYKRDPTTFVEYFENGVVLVIELKNRRGYYAIEGEIHEADVEFQDVWVGDDAWER